MADAKAKQQALVIPPEVQASFGEIVQLVAQSESMNNEERQYWINILPVMTPEQVTNLHEILTNEKNQLAAIDAKYSGTGATAPSPKNIDEIDAERKSKREKRSKAEKEHDEEEKLTEKSILDNIQNL